MYQLIYNEATSPAPIQLLSCTQCCDLMPPQYLPQVHVQTCDSHTVDVVVVVVVSLSASETLELVSNIIHLLPSSLQHQLSVSLLTLLVLLTL